MQQMYYRQQQAAGADLGQQCDKDNWPHACPILAKEPCIKRHGTVCVELHFNLREELWVKLYNEHSYQYVPRSVQTGHSGKVTILWNQQEQTDRTIPNNKPDVIVRDNEKGTYVNTLRTGDADLRF